MSIYVCLSGAMNETEELLMHHLHGDTLPCYHMSLHNFLERLRKSDLQVATRLYLQPGQCSLLQGWGQFHLNFSQFSKYTEIAILLNAFHRGTFGIRMLFIS
jgi:hypothetical protein